MRRCGITFAAVSLSCGRSSSCGSNHSNIVAECLAANCRRPGEPRSMPMMITSPQCREPFAYSEKMKLAGEAGSLL
jgi:hypothetical protein